jgi:NTE family protein
MSDNKIKKALVLSGGSIKGAFQAGVIAHVVEAGFRPDAIYGTSVGSLNGGFLAERAGRVAALDQAPDWPALGKELEDFWKNRVNSPDQIVRVRGTLELVSAIVRKKFDGLTDTAPLRKLVNDEFSAANLHASPFPFVATAVELVSGKAKYATNKDPQIVEYIIASTAIPIEMPVKWVGHLPYVDGGAREIAPLSKAIDDGADEVVCIICQPEQLGAAGFDAGNLMQYASRLMEVITNELVNNDVERFEKVNAWLRDYDRVESDLQTLSSANQWSAAATAEMGEKVAQLNKWRPVDLTVIRPDTEIILNLLDFGTEEIKSVIQLGRDTAEKVYPPSGTP